MKVKEKILAASFVSFVVVGCYVVSVGGYPISSRSGFDEIVPFATYFSETSGKEKKEILTAFAKELRRQPKMKAYVVSYGTLKTLNCEAIDNLKFAQSVIQNENNVSGKRIVYIDGGYGIKGMTELYIEPVDTVFPNFTHKINDVLNPDVES